MLEDGVILKEALGTVFGVLQSLTIMSLVAVFKMYLDVQKLKRDIVWEGG